MKTLIALALIASLSPAAYAQSRAGAGSLGNFRPSTKPTTASVKDLDRAATLAAQAQARTGSATRKSSGWAHGGSGFSAPSR